MKKLKEALVNICVVSLFIVFVNCDNWKRIEEERAKYAEKMASYMDTTVDPCNDFYQYSCGNYFKTNKRPGKERLSIFSFVSYELEETFHNIFMEPVPVKDKYSVQDKVRLFYQSCMKEDIFSYQKSDVYLKFINDYGGWPVLDRKWKPTNFDWFNVTVAAHKMGIPIFLQVFPVIQYAIFSDFEISLFDKVVLLEPYSRTFQKYKFLFKKLMMMYGASEKQANKAFKEIVKFGKEWSSIEYEFTSDEDFGSFEVGDILRQMFMDFELGQNKATNTISINKLIEKVPEIDFKTFVKAAFGDDVDFNRSVYVKSLKYYKKLSTFFSDKKHVRAAANYAFLAILYELHDEFTEAKYQKSYCIDKINDHMNQVTTAMYLNSKYYDRQIEDEILVMFSYLKSALKDIIKSATWLDKPTKKKALIKLDAMQIVIGDSEFTLNLEKMEKNFESINITDKKDFYENKLELVQYARHSFLHMTDDMFGSTVETYSAEVNAYYYLQENKFTLPAGILRKPFYYPELPKSYNFAAMGANIIGHEMTHGFDDDGKEYDEKGEQENWWTYESEDAFHERTKCFIDQYNSYRIDIADANVDGRKTLGENIADTGGLRQGYIAYKKWLKANRGSLNQDREILPGLNLTSDQLFFLGYAQTYCSEHKGRDTIEMITSDVHAIGKYRVIGSVANVEEFGKAFNCPLGSVMNPEVKCDLW